MQCADIISFPGWKELAKLHTKVQVVVLRKGLKEGQNKYQVLLLQTNQDRGGFWQNVTGSADPDETPYQAAQRELHEETGLRGDLHDLQLSFTFKDRWGREVEEKCYGIVLFTENEVIIDPSEHQSFKWVYLEQIGPQTYKWPNNYEALLRAKEIL